MTTPTHPRGREPGSPGGGGPSRGGGPSGDRKPTVRQVYALAAALAERLGEEFPATSFSFAVTLGDGREVDAQKEAQDFASAVASAIAELERSGGKVVKIERN
jgi:hypothetical protein